MVFSPLSQELKAWHRPQVECLAAAEADVLAFETIPSIKEAEALVELLKEFPNTKAWLSLSCKVKSAAAVSLWTSCAESFLLLAGREAFIRRQPVQGRGADRQQVGAADRRRRQLLPAGAGGAAAGLRQDSAEPRDKLGGLPQQWGELGPRAGVGPARKEDFIHIILHSSETIQTCILHHFL